MRKRGSTVYLPISILKEIDLLIERLGYWPSRAAFTREACLAKIKEYKVLPATSTRRRSH